MAINSRIEWTENTWNPITGCTKYSAGCLNCYAKRMAKRLKVMGAESYKSGFKPIFHENLLSKPLSWKKLRMIFVNSMSDTFHESIFDEDILKLFKTMNRAQWHTFQVQTKRSDRMFQLSPKINWTPNIWQGVTIEHTATPNFLHGKMYYIQQECGIEKAITGSSNFAVNGLGLGGSPIKDLSSKYLERQIITAKYIEDALHIATATINKVDVLVSWNFKHIVNLNKIHLFNSVNISEGYTILEIRTPKELINDN